MRDARRFTLVTANKNAPSMLCLVAGLALFLGACKKPSEPVSKIEVYGDVPEFSFVDQHKQPFTRANLLGKVSIANFIFTRCKTVCPVFTMKMQRVAEQTSSDIQILSFSVDPEYDTPKRLAAYTQERGIDDPRWHFLTGDAKKIKETVTGALKIAMERKGIDQDGVPDIVHGGHFVLIDAQAQIRGYYNADDIKRIQRLLADAKMLVQTSPKK